MSSKETKNKSRLYLSALLLLAATAVLSTVTTTGNNVFAQDDSEENSNGNSDNVADNGNGNDNAETADTAAAARGGTGGMGNCNNSPDDCEPQKDRVGNDDPTDTDADRDGPGGAGGSAGDPGQGNTGDASDEGESNCWGKVASGLAQKDDGKPGLGEHSSDPVPNNEDNETPREGVGNQQEGHPSDHADTVGGLVNDPNTPENETPGCVD